MNTTFKGIEGDKAVNAESVAARKVGRPGIEDEFAHLPVSRQRKWQLRQMAKGGCRICGQTAISKGYCLKHLVQERDHSASRFGYQRQNQNCKSRLLEKFVMETGPATSAWKHQIVSVRDQGGDTSRTTQDMLIEKWGGTGWELTSVIPQADGDTWLYFKQPMPLATRPASHQRAIHKDLSISTKVDSARENTPGLYLNSPNAAGLVTSAVSEMVS